MPHRTFGFEGHENLDLSSWCARPGCRREHSVPVFVVWGRICTVCHNGHKGFPAHFWSFLRGSQTSIFKCSQMNRESFLTIHESNSAIHLVPFTGKFQERDPDHLIAHLVLSLWCSVWTYCWVVGSGGRGQPAKTQTGGCKRCQMSRAPEMARHIISDLLFQDQLLVAKDVECCDRGFTTGPRK